jgi:phage shock protein E
MQAAASSPDSVAPHLKAGATRCGSKPGRSLLGFSSSLCFTAAWLTLAACGAAQAEDAAQPAMQQAQSTAKIGATALLARIERKDSELVVLDVRTPEEFAAGHVPGAINIPYTHLPARIAEVSGSDKDIVLYCATGVRAERAAQRLRENGYARLLHLEGDMRGWQESRLPIEKK